MTRPDAAILALLIALLIALASGCVGRVADEMSASVISGPRIAGAGEGVVLAATLPETADGGLAVAWRQLEGPEIELSRRQRAASTLSFKVEDPGAYRFQARVKGPAGWAPWGTHELVVPALSSGAASHRPVARVSTETNATVGRKVTLDARLSFDPDGERLTFHWDKIGGPDANVAKQDSQLSFLALAPGSYAFALSVEDESGLSSAPAAVSVTVARPRELQTASPDAEDPLDRPISMELENAPLDRLLMKLSGAGITVRTSSDIAESRALELIKIDLWTVELQARKVLDWLGRMLDAFYVIEEPGVVWFAKGTRWLEREPPVSVTYRIDALHEADDASDLVEFLQDSVRAALWARPDASVALSDLNSEVLTCVLPESAQRRIARVLEELRRGSGSGAPRPKDRDALSQLLIRPVRGAYDGWTLRDVLWDLARQARVVIAWPPSNETDARPITLSFDESPLREGLDLVARSAGFDGYITEMPGAIWMVRGPPPPESSECVWTAAQITSYDTTALEHAHSFSGSMLVHLIRGRVMSKRWQDPFSAIGYISARKRLVVIHATDVQRAVGTLLERLARRGEKALSD